MYEQVEKSRENKSRAVAKFVPQKTERKGIKVITNCGSRGSTSFIKLKNYKYSSKVRKNLEVIQLKDRRNQIDDLMTKRMDIESVRKRVKHVLGLVRTRVNNENIVLNGRGRDVFFYDKVAWAKDKSVTQVLNSWDSSSASDTAAMLMDYALNWKNDTIEDVNGNEHARGKYERKRIVEGTTKSSELFGKQGKAARGPNHTFEQGSTLELHALAGNYPTKSGPSASTSVLLWFLRWVGGISQGDALSVVDALCRFWGRTTKKVTGDYHTKYEAMIPLARHWNKFNHLNSGQIRKNCNMREDANVNQIITNLNTGDQVQVQWDRQRKFSLGGASIAAEHVWVIKEGDQGWVRSSVVGG
ncbi:hypothetical protein J8L98_01950 [Pseudoalteromonas sp. MMG013]|uniref:hypothetical protein n=1 Tax=Pseudoalteromonas sp. MMG013 TaxID=2822687 RepID=UPI001B392006|nr:hypothetical protein [Pseudoalteromonas sp. MMG013]MBQ4860454.1 hypothetical protein [Pseudoalteromonas sp. MMG013]